MKTILKKYGIKPSKRLGQNFLIDKNILKKIIEAAELNPEDIVLEIGPGLGILTIELAKRVKKVIAVEKDRTLSQMLEDILKTEGINNVKVINKDILQISPPEARFAARRAGQLRQESRVIGPWADKFKIVANLPYYITSPVIRKFLECNEARPRCMVLMVQKEVAQRIVAKPPHMNLLAVAVQFYAQPEIISYVSKNSFWPQPEVDSAIIKIVPKPISKINIERFFELVKSGFSSKRKFLINNLSRKLKIACLPVGMENLKLKIVFDQIGLGQKLRAENLTINDWLKLYYAICKK